ncbi:tRNA delta(2)-isopentenylpyrophosphate transferase [Bifidobacterium actinocoloniiforme DSM 22766]|uniref:tRNA dimethylallyltransferase n=1 Tax=Bifidobacterium actinocoloniiforme DSM 22766 TaxID=1437605 RepID=A0A086Z0U7_9BIFI|nr:tRNA (adenosine(37)-N6)-dimethylallyltransferase MiaA [Bifidobacterium actinocoloniiforme]AKV55341.1 tRNA delta(2)-isopentenylpyrophosphate transferase [Bifidobacterium actinocoloniiforme DSM 22766]KFI40147.1 tRNA delta(2)-isopentenylpyrophosphate transferase [Bifidobacterium actinocoloniiforme DSM 22766]
MRSAIDEKGGAPPIISIVGPTASGKTSLAVRLAQALGEQGERAEIINADPYQMYRGMDVGTAKPSAAERAAVPHHLIDIIEPEEAMSAARFQTLARAAIADFRARGIRPILVGGSGLYARAAIDDIAFPGTDPVVRGKLEERARKEGPGVLFKELEERDPAAAARMDSRNARRTIRALEVMEITGRPYSAGLPQYRYLLAAVQLGLDVDREALDRRIGQRTEQMRQGGLIEEVRALRPRLGATASRALGYQQVEDFLDGAINEDDAFDLIARKTRRLARKQMGWFGRDPRVHWLDALAPDLLERALAVVAAADKDDGSKRDGSDDSVIRHPLGSLVAHDGA